MHNLLAYDFMQRALLAALLVGCAAPLVGVFLVQRRLSLIGDGIGHVAFAGVAVGALTGQSPVWVALLFAAGAAVAIEVVRAQGRTSGDVALAIMFYGGIALGVVVMARAGNAASSMNGYLFGAITTTTRSDIGIFAALAIAVLVVTWILRPRLFAVANDPEYAKAVGLPVLALNITLAILTAVTVVVSMRVVGLLLISARRSCRTPGPSSWAAASAPPRSSRSSSASSARSAASPAPSTSRPPRAARSCSPPSRSSRCWRWSPRSATRSRPAGTATPSRTATSTATAAVTSASRTRTTTTTCTTVTCTLPTVTTTTNTTPTVTTGMTRATRMRGAPRASPSTSGGEMAEVERRTTRQRRAVEDVLRDTQDFISAQDLHLRLRQAGDTIGLATVYRTLAGMTEDEKVDMLRTEDGEARYRLCASEEHHHHLVCRECGHTVEVDGPVVEQWASQTAADHGFTGVSHTVEVFGMCATCTAA